MTSTINMMKKFIYTVIFIIGCFIANAQDPHFSQFFSSPLTLNPAFTGKFDGLWRLTTNHRDQWPSIPKAYVTTTASLDFPIMTKQLPEGDLFGIGISGLSDASSNDALKLNYASMSLSYHKALDEDGFNTIGAGFQGTYSSSSIDFSKLTFEDELQRNGFTPGTSAEYTKGLLPKVNYFDVNAGVLFSGSSDGQNNYYLGVSMYHINKPKVSFRNSSTTSNSDWFLTNRFTVHGGGSFSLGQTTGLSVSFIEQMQNKSNETVLGAAVSMRAGGLDDKPTNLYLGSWLRLNDALIPYLGLEFGDLRIGTSYDFNISDLKAVTNSKGGAEFSLIYIKHPVEYKGIPCPKF